MHVVDYCANELVANTRGPLRSEHLLNYWDDTSLYRNGTYYGWKTRSKWHHEADPSSGWLRPRWHVAIKDPWNVTPLSHSVDYRDHRHAMRSSNSAPMEVHGPGSWNLYDWLIKVAEDVTGYALGARSNTWFTRFQEWILNPATSIDDWPNVGLAYWVRFPFRCNFPQSLNCSIGIGFEQALLWVTLGFLGVIAVGALILPAVTIPFQMVGYPIAYFFIFMAVAFHTPPACMILFPSFPLPFGFTIPECAADQLMAFADKWIVNCYVPLIIPSYMVSGPPCPLSPSEYIDVINFRDIGVSDGIQHILFLGVRFFGHAFSDVVLFITSTTIGSWIPGMYPYMVATLADFNAATGTQLQRQWLSFAATALAIATPALVLYLAGAILAQLVPAVLALGESLLGAFFALPVAAAFPGANADQVYFGDGYEEAPVVERPPPQVPPPVPYQRQTLVETLLFGSAARRNLVHRRQTVTAKKNQ